MKLIGFGGLKESGKDTASRVLIDQGWTHLKFADPIWECLVALDVEVLYRGCYIKLNGVIEQLGREQAKKQIPAVRRYLERIGTEMGRSVFGEDVWVDHMRARIESMPEIVQKNMDGSLCVNEPRIVISDCRFSNEADLIRKLGGKLLLIERPGVIQGTHSSEGLNFEVDAAIMNDRSIEDLHAEIRRLVG